MKLKPGHQQHLFPKSVPVPEKFSSRWKKESNHHISQQLPMLLQGNPALGNKGTRQMPRRMPHLRPLDERLRLRQTQAESNQQNRRAGRKPIERSPTMGRRVDQRPRKDRGQQISERIALLKHTGENATSGLGTILEGGGSRITIQATHGDTEEGAHGEELLVGVAKPGAEFEDDEEDVVDDEGPLAAVSVGCDA